MLVLDKAEDTPTQIQATAAKKHRALAWLLRVEVGIGS